MTDGGDYKTKPEVKSRGHKNTGGGGRARHTQRSNMDDGGVIEFEQGGGGEGCARDWGITHPSSTRHSVECARAHTRTHRKLKTERIKKTPQAHTGMVWDEDRTRATRPPQRH